jgi:hypothetical protein
LAFGDPNFIAVRRRKHDMLGLACVCSGHLRHAQSHLPCALMSTTHCAVAVIGVGRKDRRHLLLLSDAPKWPTDFHQPFGGRANPYSRWDSVAKPANSHRGGRRERPDERFRSDFSVVIGYGG